MMKDIEKWKEDNKEFISKYLVILMVALCAGASHISSISIAYLYKDDFGMSPEEVAEITGIIFLPLILKPFYGILTDQVPIFGQRRKSYLLIFSFLDFIGWYLIAFQITSKTYFFIVFISIKLCFSFCEVVGEALIIEISKQRSIKFNMSKDQSQAEAGQNVSLYFGIKMFGVIATAFLGGYLLNFMDKHYIFAIAGTFPLFLFISSLFIPNEEEFNQRQSSQKLDQFYQLFSFLKKPCMYQPLIFVLLFKMAPSYSSAMFFFYTNVLGFDPTFFGILEFCTSVATFLGIIIYNQFLKTTNFRAQFTVSTLISTLLGFTQLFLILRVNQQLGIPDKLFTVGDQIVIEAIQQINMMPLLVFAVNLCPPKMEATIYSVVISTGNLGSSLSQYLGGVLMEQFGVSSNNFENLWLISVISTTSLLLPLFILNFIDQQNIIAARNSFLTYEDVKTIQSEESQDEQEREDVTALVSESSQTNEQCGYDTFRSSEQTQPTERNYQ